MTHPKNLVEVESPDHFKKLLSENEKVIVDFWATWCPPCRMAAPHFEKLAVDNPNILFLKVDVDQQTNLTEECAVSAMPTFQLYVKGSKVEEVVGFDQDGLDNLVKL